MSFALLPLTEPATWPVAVADVGDESDCCAAMLFSKSTLRLYSFLALTEAARVAEDVLAFTADAGNDTTCGTCSS